MTKLIQNPHFNVNGKNLDFVSEMVAGGISDDCSPLTGDVSFDDNKDYTKSTISKDRLSILAKKLNLKTVSYVQ